MRIHVQDGSRTLRGIEQVGGWFLRADNGLRMVPGEVREMGNTYEADLVVIRPGARPSTSTPPSASRPASSRASTSRRARRRVRGPRGGWPGRACGSAAGILAEGAFGDHAAKTAFGVLRYGGRDVVASSTPQRRPAVVGDFRSIPGRSQVPCWRRSERHSHCPCRPTRCSSASRPRVAGCRTRGSRILLSAIPMAWTSSRGCTRSWPTIRTWSPRAAAAGVTLHDVSARPSGPRTTAKGRLHAPGKRVILAVGRTAAWARCR